MADHDHDDFASGDAGSAETFPQQCSALRKGGHVMIKGHPCKIVEMSTSKTGKHGHAKVHLVALDIFTDKKYEDICPSTHNMNVPHVKRKDYTLLDVEKDDPLNFTLMNDQGDTHDHLEKKDTDLLKKIRDRCWEGENFGLTVLSACGIDQIIATKVIN